MLATRSRGLHHPRNRLCIVVSLIKFLDVNSGKKLVLVFRRITPSGIKEDVRINCNSLAGINVTVDLFRRCGSLCCCSSERCSLISVRPAVHFHLDLQLHNRHSLTSRAPHPTDPMHYACGLLHGSSLQPPIAAISSLVHSISVRVGLPITLIAASQISPRWAHMVATRDIGRDGARVKTVRRWRVFLIFDLLSL